MVLEFCSGSEIYSSRFVGYIHMCILWKLDAGFLSTYEELEELEVKYKDVIDPRLVFFLFFFSIFFFFCLGHRFRTVDLIVTRERCLC